MSSFLWVINILCSFITFNYKNKLQNLNLKNKFPDYKVFQKNNIAEVFGNFKYFGILS